MSARKAPSDGFALLIVLWTLVLVTLLVTQITSAGRSETQLAGNLRAASRLEAAADGGVNEAIFRLMDHSSQGWRAGPDLYPLALGTAGVEIRIVDLGGRVNPSNATPALLRQVLIAVGVGADSAANLAASIVEWRTPHGDTPAELARFDRYRAAGRMFGPSGAAFASLDELGSVLGMTPDLLARLAPHLTLYTDADPDAGTADDVVRAALTALNNGRLPPPAPPAGPGSGQLHVMEITATAHEADGRFTRHAIVRLTDAATQNARIVAWDPVPSG